MSPFTGSTFTFNAAGADGNNWKIEVNTIIRPVGVLTLRGINIIFLSLDTGWNPQIDLVGLWNGLASHLKNLISVALATPGTDLEAALLN